MKIKKLNTRSKFKHMNLRYSLIAILALAMTSCSTTSVAEEEELFENETIVEEVTVTLTSQEKELFDLVNLHRKSKDLNTLEFSDEAYKYALEHNEFMISQGKLSHENFGQRAAQISNETAANYVAENVAKDYSHGNMALQGWLNSASHRKTIEGDFTHAALSIKEDASGNPYYTQIFFRK